jgi:hypothetical protein
MYQRPSRFVLTVTAFWGVMPCDLVLDEHATSICRVDE